LAEARRPVPTQRCRLSGGTFDGQLRLIAVGTTLALTIRHELDGQWWTETYQHEGAVAEVPAFGLVRDLVFRERRPVAGDADPDSDRRSGG
jgi:hypothetical protein